MSALLEAAVQLVSIGRPVLPLHNVTAGGTCSCGRGENCKPGKHPRTPRGVHDASIDPDAIRAWWARWPNANIGMTCTGLAILDIDPRNGGDVELDRLLAGNAALPPTLTQATGGDGQHLVFRESDSTPLRGKLGPGIDVLHGPGKYIVVEPSMTTGPYRWVTAGPAAPLPGWVHGLLQHDTPSRVSGRGSPVVADQGDIVSRLSPQIREMIDTAYPVGQRSEPEMAVVDALVAQGASDETIAAILDANPIGAIFRERGARQEYIARIAERARKFVGGPREQYERCRVRILRIDVGRTPDYALRLYVGVEPKLLGIGVSVPVHPGMWRRWESFFAALSAPTPRELDKESLVSATRPLVGRELLLELDPQQRGNPVRRFLRLGS